MTEPEKPQLPGLMELFNDAPKWTRVLFVVALVGVVIAILAWSFGLWDVGERDVDDGGTVSAACADHFEKAAAARASFESTPRGGASTSWLGIDLRDAFEDCDSVEAWRVAAAAHPGAFDGDTDFAAFVRQSCDRDAGLAGSQTCLNLD